MTYNIPTFPKEDNSSPANSFLSLQPVICSCKHLRESRFSVNGASILYINLFWRFVISSLVINYTLNWKHCIRYVFKVKSRTIKQQCWQCTTLPVGDVSETRVTVVSVTDDSVSDLVVVVESSTGVDVTAVKNKHYILLTELGKRILSRRKIIPQCTYF